MVYQIYCIQLGEYCTSRRLVQYSPSWMQYIWYTTQGQPILFNYVILLYLCLSIIWTFVCYGSVFTGIFIILINLQTFKIILIYYDLFWKNSRNYQMQREAKLWMSELTLKRLGYFGSWKNWGGGGPIRPPLEISAVDRAITAKIAQW